MNISLSKNIEFKDYTNKGLLIDTNNGSYRKINSSGLFITQLVKDKEVIDVEEIYNQVSKYYNIPVKLIKDDTKSFIDDLVKRGYFITGTEKIIDESHHENSNSYNGIWIKVTNRCNLYCKYCYANSNISNKEYEISVKEIEKVLDELKDENYKKIVITGGEPLLREDILDIVKTCNKYGLVQVLTNGTIGDKELYEQLLKYVSMIQISLDSYESSFHDNNRSKGSFDKSLNTIKMINSISDNKVTISMTPTPEYTANIKKMIDFCIGNNVRNLHINRFVPYGRASDNYSTEFNLSEFYKWVDEGYDYLSQLYISALENKEKFYFNLDVASDLRKAVYSKGVKRSCGLNKNIFSLDSNGDVYLCPSLHKEELVLGNIKKNSIKNILENSRDIYGDMCVENLNGCKECEIRYFCGGGCRALAYHYSGNISCIDNNCDVYKNRAYDLMLK